MQRDVACAPRWLPFDSFRQREIFFTIANFAAIVVPSGRAVNDRRLHVCVLMRRLRNVGSMEDLEAPARRFLPHCIFSYVMFGVETGVSVRANRVAFDDWAFAPRVLRDVS